MTVRDAKMEDAEAISVLLARVIQSLDIYSAQARRSEIEKYGPASIQKIVESGIAVVATNSNDEIVGTCIGYGDDALVWLSWFVVDEDHRRQGMTASMLALFLDRARMRSHKVWCDCRTTNTASIKLLESAGFKKIATVENHWYGQDFILWHRFLSC